MDWVSIAIQAGGAVGVCGMFLWFLDKRSKSETAREKQFFAQLDKQTAYLRERDAQSKEIALNGHEALRAVAEEVRELREEVLRRLTARRAKENVTDGN